VPGFGSLNFKEEEVRAMVSRLFGEAPAEPAPEPVRDRGAPVADSGEPTVEPAIDSPGAPDRMALSADTSISRAVADSGNVNAHAAPQNAPDIEEERQLSQRKHGAALPK